MNDPSFQKADAEVAQSKSPTKHHPTEQVKGYHSSVRSKSILMTQQRGTFFSSVDLAML